MFKMLAYSFASLIIFHASLQHQLKDKAYRHGIIDKYALS